MNKPYNVYIGPEPKRGEIEWEFLINLAFLGYSSPYDDYVNVVKNRLNGKTGYFLLEEVYEWVNELNKPFDPFPNSSQQER